MSRARSGIAAVPIMEQNKVIVLGDTYCAVFDTVSRTWSDPASSPPPPMRNRHISGCVAVHDKCDNRIYVMGKENGAMESFLFGDRRHGRQDRVWQGLPPVMTPRKYCAATIIHDGAMIVVVGGCDRSYTHHTIVEAFHTHNQTWSRLPDMAQCRSGSAVTCVQNNVYVFGGWDGSTYLDTAEVLDTARGIWEPLPNMPRIRSFASAVAVGHHILVLGGQGLEGVDAMNQVDCFDTKTLEWITAPPLQEARCKCAAVCIGEEVYVFGGSDHHGVYLNTVEVASIHPYHTILPRFLLPLLKKQQDGNGEQEDHLPLGIWSFIIARCSTPSIVYFILCSERFQLDSVLPKSQKEKGKKRKAPGENG